MRALTLHQPWGSLSTFQVKTLETRGWAPTRPLDTLAIHAARRSMTGHDVQQLHRSLAAADLPDDQLRQILSHATRYLGVIVATCRVAGIQPVGKARKTRPDQLCYGDYAAGRVAWILTDIVPLDPPVLARGRQGLWTWEPTS